MRNVTTSVTEPKQTASLLVKIAEAADVPTILLKVAYCESGNLQTKNGKVVSGPDGHDKGRFQIRDIVHQKDAEKLGMNIYTWEGNTAYALYLYKHHGLTPWNSSRHCWTSPLALKEKGYPG
jgi:hypothetical protein